MFTKKRLSIIIFLLLGIIAIMTVSIYQSQKQFTQHYHFSLLKTAIAAEDMVIHLESSPESPSSTEAYFHHLTATSHFVFRIVRSSRNLENHYERIFSPLGGTYYQYLDGETSLEDFTDEMRDLHASLVDVYESESGSTYSR